MIEKVTIAAALKQGIKAGLIASGINIAWFFSIEYSLSLQGLPKGFASAIVLSTLIANIIGSLVYLLFNNNFSKGRFLFLFISIGFIILSCLPSFDDRFFDGTPIPPGFVLLTLPLHAIAGIIGVWFMLKTPVKK